MIKIRNRIRFSFACILCNSIEMSLIRFSRPDDNKSQFTKNSYELRLIVRHGQRQSIHSRKCDSLSDSLCCQFKLFRLPPPVIILTTFPIKNRRARLIHFIELIFFLWFFLICDFIQTLQNRSWHQPHRVRIGLKTKCASIFGAIKKIRLCAFAMILCALRRA